MENVNKYILIIASLILSCTPKKDLLENRIHLSQGLLDIAEQYYANFREPEDTIRFIQLLEFGTDTSKVVLHCFGKDASLLNQFNIIAVDSINSESIYIGIRKNKLIGGETIYFEYEPAIREYCPWLIGSSGENTIILSTCFQQSSSELIREIKFEDIEEK